MLTVNLPAIDAKDLSGIAAIAALLSDPVRAAQLTQDIAASYDAARAALAEVISRDADLATREAALADRAGAVATAETEINARRANLQKKETDFESWSAGQAAKINSRRDDLDQRETELTGREVTLQNDIAKLRSTIGA
jgi:predicted  nucleic acid-binding Zn-ribbon protein